MAISVNWVTKVITVPRAYMTVVQVSPEIRTLDVNLFRLDLKDLEADEEGMPFVRTHNNNPPVTVGGVTLARVIELINGYTVTFEDGQYAVNLQGANNNIADVANVNQVSIRSANSVGLTYSKEMEDQAFSASRVWVNTDRGTAGTNYPQGTPAYPVDTFDDAASIIVGRRLAKRIHVHGDLSLDSLDDMDNFDIVGDSPSAAALTFTNVPSDQASMTGVRLTGSLDGEVSLIDCLVGSVTGFAGRMKSCGLTGPLKLASATLHALAHCVSVVPGDTKPTLDCNDLDNLSVNIRDYSGGIKVTNFTGTNCLMSIDLNPGGVELDSTCTSGQILVRGVGNLIDNSGAGCDVVTDGLLAPDELNSKLDNNFAVSAAGL